MTDYEVERALGFTPCICGDVACGTWHSECYRGKTQAEIDAGYKRAFAKARHHLKQRAEPIGKSDCGHGHVWPRADGVMARCGGPALCKLCAVDAAAPSGADHG